jgi:chromosome segregation ATPase
MKPNMRLVGDAPPRTPERESLAEAIARHAEATDQLAAVRAARERTEEARHSAEEATAKAKAAIEQAKIDTAAALVGGTPGAPGTSVKAARAALQDCEDALEAAVAAGSVLAESAEEAERELARAERDVDRAVEAVVKASTEIRALVGRLKTAYAELVDVRNALRAVQSRLPDDLKILGSVDIPSIHQDDLKLAATWRAAIAALATDPDALLPTS